MTRWLLLTALIFTVTAIPCASIHGADAPTDWPTFRGANRDDHSSDKGLLKQWPKAGPPLAWKQPAKGLGTGYASVSVVGDKVFTMGDVGDSSFVFGLDRATGKEAWKAKVGKMGPHNQANGPGCTPTVDDGLVYAINLDGDMVCLEAASGTEKWRKSFPKDFGGKVGGWHYQESPLIDGEKVVCTPGGKDAGIVALNKKTGDVIWKAAIPGNDRAEYSSIVIGEVGGIRQYIQLMSGGVVGVNAKDGKFLWRYDKLGGNTANCPTPIVKGDLVFCVAGYGKGGGLVKLTPAGEGIKAEEVYYNGELKNKHGGVVLVGDYLYGDRDEGGNPYCAELKTGKVQPGWSKGQPKDGKKSMSLTYADGFLICRYENGFVALVEATPTGYKERGSFKIDNPKQPCWAHPVVVDGKLYLRDQDQLWCYNIKGK